LSKGPEGEGLASKPSDMTRLHNHNVHDMFFMERSSSPDG
jgi:hypothetical protein